jgi:hypothetical protein
MFYNVANNGNGKATIRNKRVEQTIVKMEKELLIRRCSPRHFKVESIKNVVNISVKTLLKIFLWQVKQVRQQ